MLSTLSAIVREILVQGYFWKETVMVRRQIIRSSDLIRVAPTCCVDENGQQHSAKYGVTIGDIVHLNSGSHDMVVVDLNDTDVVTSWEQDGKIYETKFPKPCLHHKRVSESL